MPSFEMNVSDWYTPVGVEENDYLNNLLEDNNYGIYYSVRFEGDAETFLWMAKSAPVAGEKYYGHLEKAKSGKSVKFKKDKVPENEATPQGANKQSAANSQSTDESIARAVALKAAVDFIGAADEAPEIVLKTADIFLGWLKGGTAQVTAKAVDKVFNGKEPLPEMPDGFLQDDENEA